MYAIFLFNAILLTPLLSTLFRGGRFKPGQLLLGDFSVYVPNRPPYPGESRIDPEQAVLHAAGGTLDVFCPGSRLDPFHATGIVAPDLAEGPGLAQTLCR